MVSALFEINKREKTARKAHCVANLANQWSKSGISGDTSQHGNWDNIRNVKHNGHPMKPNPKCPSKVL